MDYLEHGALLAQRGEGLKAKELADLKRLSGVESYLSTKDYETFIEQGNVEYETTLASAQALITADGEPVPLIPDMNAARYNESIDIETAARELAVPVTALRAVIEGKKNDIAFQRRMFSTRFQRPVDVREAFITQNLRRESFEHNFCFLKELIATEGDRSGGLPRNPSISTIH